MIQAYTDESLKADFVCFVQEKPDKHKGATALTEDIDESRKAGEAFCEIRKHGCSGMNAETEKLNTECLIGPEDANRICRNSMYTADSSSAAF